MRTSDVVRPGLGQRDRPDLPAPGSRSQNASASSCTGLERTGPVGEQCPSKDLRKMARPGLRTEMPAQPYCDEYVAKRRHEKPCSKDVSVAGVQPNLSRLPSAGRSTPTNYRVQLPLPTTSATRANRTPTTCPVWTRRSNPLHYGIPLHRDAPHVVDCLTQSKALRVAAFYLPVISKLKLGGAELQKSVSEQVSVPVALGLVRTDAANHKRPRLLRGLGTGPGPVETDQKPSAQQAFELWREQEPQPRGVVDAETAAAGE